MVNRSNFIYECRCNSVIFTFHKQISALYASSKLSFQWNTIHNKLNYLLLIKSFIHPETEQPLDSEPLGMFGIWDSYKGYALWDTPYRLVLVDMLLSNIGIYLPKLYGVIAHLRHLQFATQSREIRSCSTVVAKYWLSKQRSLVGNGGKTATEEWCSLLGTRDINVKQR